MSLGHLICIQDTLLFTSINAHIVRTTKHSKFLKKYMLFKIGTESELWIRESGFIVRCVRQFESLTLLFSCWIFFFFFWGVRIKLFCLEFFKGQGYLFLIKLVNWAFFFVFFIFYFLIFTGNFCCWAIFVGLVYFALDFRSIIFYMVTKMRKILEL